MLLGGRLEHINGKIKLSVITSFHWTINYLLFGGFSELNEGKCAFFQPSTKFQCK